MCALLCLASFTQYSICTIHPCCCMCLWFIAFNSWGVFHCKIHIYYNVFISFPVGKYLEFSGFCLNKAAINTSLYQTFCEQVSPFSWIVTPRNGICRCMQSAKLVSRVQVYTLPPEMCESFWDSISSPLFSVIYSVTLKNILFNSSFLTLTEPLNFFLMISFNIPRNQCAAEFIWRVRL